MPKHKTNRNPLPEFFNRSIFQKIANFRSANPVEFARLYLSQSSADCVAIHHFGGEPHNACLIDRNGPVLMVAHVDTVMDSGGSASVAGFRLRHPTIDNRLGIYLGFHLLPRMGIACDVLLTTDEEVGLSTGALAIPDRMYNWMFSFDRAGEDAVCYQYTSQFLTNILQESRFVVGEGSYSCISDMGHFGCAGINFGCGMANYHSPKAYCDLRQLNRQLLRFRHFYQAHAGIHIPSPR